MEFISFFSFEKYVIKNSNVWVKHYTKIYILNFCHIFKYVWNFHIWFWLAPMIISWLDKSV